MSPCTHYHTLSVAPDAPPEVVRAAYLALARLHHPDGSDPDEERIRQINAAWNVLRRPDSRSRYDAELAQAAAHASDDGDDDGHHYAFGRAGWGEEGGDDDAFDRGEEHVAPQQGRAGWGEHEEEVSLLIEDVEDPKVAGARASAREPVAGRSDRPPETGRPQLVLVPFWLVVLAGVTWFGAARVDTAWALASGALGLVACFLAWRRREKWALSIMLCAWACALVPVLSRRELLSWRGWDGVGGWIGWWLTVLLWLGGIAISTLGLLSSFDAETRPQE